MGIKQDILKLKFEVRSVLSREPSLAPLYQPFIWWAQYKMRDIIDIEECRVGRRTEIVIDGFQGSGNSFATAAFKLSQPRDVRIAHHLHSPAQILKALHFGIPILVTLRSPEGAAVSLVSRWPYLSLNQALRGYIGFYSKLQPYADNFVISRFRETTQNLGQVLHILNERFGTDFSVFEPTTENMKVLRDPSTVGSEVEMRRNAEKAQKTTDLLQPVYRNLLQEAEDVYRRFGSWAVEPNKPDDTGDGARD